MHKILYVPLDERPCNYAQPLMLSKITDDMEMIAPPAEDMGKLKTPCKSEKVWQWLFDNAKDADYALLSVDTLVYGNIIHSRIHQRTMEQIDEYMNNFKKLKEINPNLKIHAFNLVARVAGYDGDFEDPEYWNTHGYAIWRYGWLEDRINRKLDEPGEKEEFEKLKKDIPAEYLDDFLSRRVKDRYVNHKAVDFTRDGIFERLVVPKDDTAEYGYAATDQALLSKKIYDEKLWDKVMVYPGADEVGSVMFTRIFNEIHNFTPKIFIKYSSTLGPTIIPRYEDRPIAESLKSQITSLGGIIVNDPKDADLLYAAHTPGKFMIECADQFENRDLTFTSHTNLHEFFAYINYFADTYNKPIALADIAYSNGSDDEMMRFAEKTGILDKISAYGGWNTTENTNGMCLSHIVLHTYFAKDNFKCGNELSSIEFLAHKILEDWLFQANIGFRVAAEIPNMYPGYDGYHLADLNKEVSEYMGTLLEKNIKEMLHGKLKGYNVKSLNHVMPWDRTFELFFKVELTK